MPLDVFPNGKCAFVSKRAIHWLFEINGFFYDVSIACSVCMMNFYSYSFLFIFFVSFCVQNSSPCYIFTFALYI